MGINRTDEYPYNIIYDLGYNRNSIKRLNGGTLKACMNEMLDYICKWPKYDSISSRPKDKITAVLKRLYCDRQSVQYIAQKLGLKETQVYHYRHIGLEYLRQIQDETGMLGKLYEE